MKNFTQYLVGSRRALRATVVSCLVVLAACGSDGVTSPELQVLDKNLTLWKAVGGADYIMLQQRSCECANTETYRVSVVGDHITAAINLTTGVALPSAQLNTFLTVNQLFDRIRTLLATKDAHVTVTYDTGSGYPKNAFLDPSPNVADDEITYVTSSVGLPLQ